MGLESLSAARRTQYDALLPEVRRSAQAASNARGGFYSGAAIDAETRAEADLLAKLAGQDASEQAVSSENARNRELEEKIKGEEIKAAKRGQLLEILGSGVGAAATLGGLSLMNPKVASGGVWALGPNGTIFNTQTGAVMPAAAGGAATGVGGAALAPAGLDSLAAATPGVAGWNNPALVGSSPLGAGAPYVASPMATAGAGVGDAAGTVGAAGVTAAKPSMWQTATKGGVGTTAARIGLGAAGGLAGSSLANLIAGRSSLGADVGAGVGGAAVPLAMLAKGYSNPWALGLGALGGSLGGGLLGNLFK